MVSLDGTTTYQFSLLFGLLQPDRTSQTALAAKKVRSTEAGGAYYEIPVKSPDHCYLAFGG